MNTRTATRISAAFGFLGVALGAFGAHGLQPRLTELHTVDVWKTAASYQLVHAVAMLFLAGRPRVSPAWGLFLAGIVVFSGSLYALACTRLDWLGILTPLGGLSFLAGWLWLALRGLPE